MFRRVPVGAGGSMDQGRKRSRKTERGTPLAYTPGYSIFVYGTGDVRIDVPTAWHMTQTEHTTELRDRPEPETSGLIQITVFPRSPLADVPGVPLRRLFRDMQARSGEEVVSRGAIHEVKERDLQMLWQETRYVDAAAGRIARATTHLARGWHRHVVITCTCWDEERERFAPIYEIVRRSLRIDPDGDALTGQRSRTRDN